MTRDQAHFAHAESKSHHLRSARAHFKGTSSQGHHESRLMLQREAWIFGKLKYVDFNPRLDVTPILI
jgi:hypothetical protein